MTKLAKVPGTSWGPRCARLGRGMPTSLPHLRLLQTRLRDEAPYPQPPSQGNWDSNPNLGVSTSKCHCPWPRGLRIYQWESEALWSFCIFQRIWKPEASLIKPKWEVLGLIAQNKGRRPGPWPAPDQAEQGNVAMLAKSRG